MFYFVYPRLKRGSGVSERGLRHGRSAEAIDQAMFDVYRRAKDEAGYPANSFLRMIMDDGGLATAKALINAPKPSDGYTALYMRGRLDLTVEAVVLEDERWRSLFAADELARAKKRLTDYRYQFKFVPGTT